MTPPPNNSRPELEERLRFETLIAGLSSKFVNLPADQVDHEVEDAQRRVCELLGLDLCVLWQWTHGAPRYITITHLYRPLGGPPPPERIDAEDMAPWCVPQVLAQKVVAIESMDSLPPEAARDKEVWQHYGIKSALVFPLSAGGQNLGAVTFNTVRQERLWQKGIVNRLTVVAQVFANALARKVADEALRESMAENERLRERLQAESDYLKAEIKVTAAHGDIIGRSRAIRQVLSQVEQVAPTDSSVLIRGETGTGKELIAQAIHRLSPRHDHVMVKVNCAALPSALVESELFGREKGAFTGALTRQIGRFEVADGSTIFLDEIGELRTIPDLLRYEPKFSLNAIVDLAFPIGEYDNDKVLNLGQNRWYGRVGAPVVWQIGPWVPGKRTTLEMLPSVWFFSDNNDYVGQTLSTDPMFQIEAHLTRDFTEHFWSSVDSTYMAGGKATVSGVEGDPLDNLGIGFTLGYQINDNISLTAGYMATVNDSEPTDLRMDGFRISFTYGWHKIVEGQNRLKNEE